MSNKLMVGEKYLSIKLVGHGEFVTAYPNKEKTKPSQPDFKGDGVGVWIHEKQEPKNKPQKEVFGKSL